MASRRKNEFVLDCCNSKSSRLRIYQSEKDAFLAGYFAMKRSRNNGKSRRNLRKPEKLVNRGNVREIYFKENDLKHSHTTKSLPPIRPEKKMIQPLSKDEFREMLSKYRAGTVNK